MSKTLLTHQLGKFYLQHLLFTIRVNSKRYQPPTIVKKVHDLIHNRIPDNPAIIPLDGCQQISRVNVVTVFKTSSAHVNIDQAMRLNYLSDSGHRFKMRREKKRRRSPREIVERNRSACQQNSPIGPKCSTRAR